MILIVCLPCTLVIRVLPSVEEQQGGELESLVGRLSGFWPDKYPCPRCDKMMRGILESDADPNVLKLMTLKDLTPHETFAALNGLGFPDEQDCTMESLLGLMRAQPVRRLHGANVQGSTRCVIEVIELWDGSKIYLGGCPEGAVAYRATRPVSAVKRLEREEGSHE